MFMVRHHAVAALREFTLVHAVACVFCDRRMVVTKVIGRQLVQQQVLITSSLKPVYLWVRRVKSVVRPCWVSSARASSVRVSWSSCLSHHCYSEY